MSCGGWNFSNLKPCDLPQNLASAVPRLLDSLAGAGYTPVLYAGTQVVNGLNHLLICKKVAVTNPPSESLAAVIINDPPNGAPGGEDMKMVSAEDILK